jgi:phosphatidylserine synthase
MLFHRQVNLALWMPFLAHLCDAADGSAALALMLLLP